MKQDGKRKLPELLAPAGSPEALDAALQAGADAVYLGGPSFNARASAPNFSWEELQAAVRRAHAFGTKIYVTLNTQIYDREMSAYLDAAARAYACGVDALIVADLGGAAAIHDCIPDLPLHASTQCSGHALGMASVLARAGYTRMVAARELTQGDITRLCAESPIEIEMFVHGALCVSHSGQCLFSSVVGGRSGNRGECAQPCRLPYGCGAGRTTVQKDCFPLSLKDLSLAPYVPELIASGVASLKIEGRMKSPAYVFGVTSIWRKLLDEGRAAAPQDMERLSAIFSRGGFTDGYYTERIGKKMLGVRSEADKAGSRAETFAGLQRVTPLDMAVAAERPAALTVTARLPSGEVPTATVVGDVPQAARTAPLSCDDVVRCLSKLGGTGFAPGRIDVTLDEGLMMPVSQLNALRRGALEALENELTPIRKVPNMVLPAVLRERPAVRSGRGDAVRTARFYAPGQIPADARDFFDAIELPLQSFSPDVPCDTVVLPPVIMDHELPEIVSMLEAARKAGVTRARVTNPGHVALAADAGMQIAGDFRLNVCNSASGCVQRSLGLTSVILSPELTLPQMRDIVARLGQEAAEVIVYGRLPLMTLEKCVLRDHMSCDDCAAGRGQLCDRRGVVFPVRREYRHRNVVYNSVPLWMADRRAALSAAGITHEVFLFTTESAGEVRQVMTAYRTGAAPACAVRRIADKS